MISKEELLECSIANFTTFGSKRFTMDELAHTLAISKKTIYKYYNSKEDLVVASVSLLVNNFNVIVDTIIAEQEDPLICIIDIYKKGFEYLKHFTPSFIFGLKKYYPKANEVFNNFRGCIVNVKIYGLLEDAKKQGIINFEVNLQLFCDLYFKRFEEVALRNSNLIDSYSNKALLNHFVVYNLKGITVAAYTNPYFE